MGISNFCKWNMASYGGIKWKQHNSWNMAQGENLLRKLSFETHSVFIINIITNCLASGACLKETDRERDDESLAKNIKLHTFTNCSQTPQDRKRRKNIHNKMKKITHWFNNKCLLFPRKSQFHRFRLQNTPNFFFFSQP